MPSCRTINKPWHDVTLFCAEARKGPPRGQPGIMKYEEIFGVKDCQGLRPASNLLRLLTCSPCPQALPHVPSILDDQTACGRSTLVVETGPRLCEGFLDQRFGRARLAAPLVLAIVRDACPASSDQSGGSRQFIVPKFPFVYNTLLSGPCGP